ncbi:MAG: hypothetical protein AAF634_17160 [Bacteroidota bacterium]
MKTMNIKSVSSQELFTISGGHKGFFYKLGVISASNVLFGLGILAGISEGIDEGVN